jgi:hypothetical protein
MIPYISYLLYQAERPRARAEQLAADQATGELAEALAALSRQLARRVALAWRRARAGWARVVDRAVVPAPTPVPSRCVCPPAS